MCGRFTLTIPDYASLASALGVGDGSQVSGGSAPPTPRRAALEELAAGEAAYRPRYNVAPTDPHWILRVKEGVRQILPARWGLVNSWAKDASGAFRQINARAETAATRPAFREAFEKRRCVVPADGFFEWVGPKEARRPIWFHAPPHRRLLFFAGLYESWRDAKADAWVRTFTILTTAANDLVSQAHDRMPVVLAPEDVGPWLHGGGASLLHPAPSDALVATFVSPRANSVKNDDPGCLEEVAQEATAIAEPRAARRAVKGHDRPPPEPGSEPAAGPLFAAPLRPARPAK